MRWLDSLYCSIASFVPFIRLKSEEELDGVRIKSYVSLMLTVLGAILIPLALVVFTGLMN